MGEISDDMIDDFIFGRNSEYGKRERESERLRYAKEKIMDLGFAITFESKSEIQFQFNNELVRFFPYTGWATGKSITDGRGLRNLLKQLKP